MLRFALAILIMLAFLALAVAVWVNGGRGDRLPAPWHLRAGGVV